jgi:hypothetical protein
MEEINWCNRPLLDSVLVLDSCFFCFICSYRIIDRHKLMILTIPKSSKLPGFRAPLLARDVAVWLGLPGSVIRCPMRVFCWAVRRWSYRFGGDAKWELVCTCVWTPDGSIPTVCGGVSNPRRDSRSWRLASALPSPACRQQVSRPLLFPFPVRYLPHPWSLTPTMPHRCWPAALGILK